MIFVFYFRRDVIMHSFPRRTKQNLVILLILILLVVYIVKIQKVYQTTKPISFIGFNNVTGDKNLIVPNIIHYVHFDKKILPFVPFICICSGKPCSKKSPELSGIFPTRGGGSKEGHFPDFF